MSRTKGTLGISATFEPQAAGPLDSRMTTATKADLLLTATWTANDSNVYAYIGMLVTVTADATPAFNGLYQLTAADYTQAANWTKIESSAPTYTTYSTLAALKAATPTEPAIAFCMENEVLYNYCATCAATADDDLVTITGNGGTTRWESIQHTSRNFGDTGWIYRDSATISAISSIAVRINLATAGTIAIKGKRIPLTAGNHDLTITGTAGVKFIYFDDATGVLKQRDTVWDMATEVPVMVVYWSGTAIVAAPQTELHGLRDIIWHIDTHNNRGLAYVSGLSFTSNVQADTVNNPGADDTVAYLWSTDGVVQDEDVQATPGTGQWAQTLGSGLTSATAAIFGFFYYNGTFVTTNAAMADRSPFIYSGANGPPRWNNAGTLEDSVTGDYIVYHYFATPMIGGWSVFSRPHNAKYLSLAAARAARPSQLTWSNYAELKHIYTAIFRVNTGWSTTHRCKLVALDDYRLVAGTPVAATAPTSHQSLSSLELAGAGVTYGHIDDQPQTIAGAKTFTTTPVGLSTETMAKAFALVLG